MSNIMFFSNCFVSRVVRITVEEQNGKHWHYWFRIGAHILHLFVKGPHTSICLDRPIKNKIHENIACVFEKCASGTTYTFSY